MDGEKIRAELARIAGNDGSIDPGKVVEVARDPKHPLHGYFDWNDEEAARKHRLDQARSLIRRYRVEVETRDVTYRVPLYTRDPAKPGSQTGYRAHDRITNSDRAHALRSEIRRARGMISRAAGMAAALQLEDQRIRLQSLADEAEAISASIITAETEDQGTATNG